MISTYSSALARRAVRLALVVFLLVAPASVAHAEVLSADRIDGVAPSVYSVPRDALPDVGMRSGLLVTGDGHVLWSRRETERRSIASITKVMTAVLALEQAEADDIVTIPAASTAVGESTSYLVPGERLSMHEVLEALLIKSGNDAAVAIAAHVSGSVPAFVLEMNRKARELGLTGTSFSNPHGLDAPGHYSSARDVAVLTRYAMTKPEFRAIVAEKTAVIGSGSRGNRVENTNILVGNYDGLNGVKTGHTDEAGYCVVNSAARNGVELFAVVLGSDGDMLRFQDARDLLDFGFAHYRPQRVATKGSALGEARVTDYVDVTVNAKVSADSTVTVLDLAGPIKRTISVTDIKAPVKKGDRVGVATFAQNGEIVATVPLVASHSVPVPTVMQRIGIALVRIWRAVTG